MKTKQRQRKDGRPDKKILAEIVQRVVEAASQTRSSCSVRPHAVRWGLNIDIDLNGHQVAAKFRPRWSGESARTTCASPRGPRRCGCRACYTRRHPSLWRFALSGLLPGTAGGQGRLWGVDAIHRPMPRHCLAQQGQEQSGRAWPGHSRRLPGRPVLRRPAGG